MTWNETEPGKYRLLGPYESFQSRTDAEAWEPLSSCWVDRIRTRVVGIKSFCRGSLTRHSFLQYFFSKPLPESLSDNGISKTSQFRDMAFLSKLLSMAPRIWLHRIAELPPRFPIVQWVRCVTATRPLWRWLQNFRRFQEACLIFRTPNHPIAFWSAVANVNNHGLNRLLVSGKIHCVAMENDAPPRLKEWRHSAEP